MSVIVTKGLCRSYGTRRGISDVNLKIEQGEIFGFLGPNGAGKSTTIRILMGLLPPGSGSASILGLDCWSQGPGIRRDVGYVAGDVRLYPWLTTVRGLRLLSRVHGRSLMESGLALAERFRLEPDLAVRKMSRGNRQKVALVLAMASKPKLLILDEPTSGLDPLMQDTLLDCLREMAAGGGTVMFSSHTLSEVETLCDHIAIVKDGRIVEDSSLAVLKAQAPRQIAVTLRHDQDAAAIDWRSVPGTDLQWVREDHCSVHTATTDSSKPAQIGSRVVHLELHGSAAGFVKWAAEQNFRDVMIGAPSLEVLFRKYYQTTNGGAASDLPAARINDVTENV